MEDKIYKVLVFSDTHGYLREIPFIKNPGEYDYFLYMGDGYEEVATWAENNGINDKFIAVTGNCDFAPRVSRQKIVEIDSIKIFITHGDLFKVKENYKTIFNRARELNVDIAMFGHTHYADHQLIDGIHLFNPGSVIPRGRDYASVGYLEIQNGKILQLEHLTF